MNNPLSLKKPKTEPQQSSGETAAFIANDNGEEEVEQSIQEQEELLLALIEHRTAEVENCRRRVAYYKSQLDIADKRLKTTQSKLAHLRCQDNSSRNSGRDCLKEVNIKRRSSSPIPISEDSSQSHSEDNLPLGYVTPSKSSANSVKNVKLERRTASPMPAHCVKNVKLERRSASPMQLCEDLSQNQPQSRLQLLIPNVNKKISQPLKTTGSTTKSPSVSGAQPSASQPTHVNSVVKLEKDRYLRTSSGQGADENQAKGKKRKFEQKEHRDLISMISRSFSPCKISCQTGCIISSQHKRKLRSLILCPTNEQLFVTSALDGVVNLWQIQGKGSNANLLSTNECASLKQRRWPEDIAWHPEGNHLFSVYCADGGDSQISILNFNKAKGKTRLSFLEEKPHLKGIINNIEFMPWDDTCFVTGGSDHGVLLWTEKNGDLWKSKALHRSMHSSAVMGVAGMQQKQVVISVGSDKRIIGFDLLAGRADYKHQIESKCMSVLPNPCDFNLFMIQTGTPERQLRLFDIRLRQTEIHAFGWKQESSESQSALINQAWSPDGLYLTSGSADPMIHVFDIRYNAHKPSQSIRAHHKRVFKAAWHAAFPLLISISSDLNIGLHKVS